MPLVGAQAQAGDENRSEASDSSQSSQLREYLAKTPGDANLWRRLAAAEAADGDLDKAYDAIMQAMTLAPADRDIQMARANILLWRGEPAQAQAQADMVRAVDPAYPGLAEFDLAHDRFAGATRGFGLLSVTAVAGYSAIEFANGASQSWDSGVLAIAFGNKQATIFELEADAQRRATTDVRISGRATFRTDSGAYYLGAGVTPQADFRDQWRLVAGGDAALAPRLRGSLDIRLAKYATGLSAGIEPGLSYQPSPVFSLSAKMINLVDDDGDYRVGGALRADYTPGTGHSLFVSAARYPDREADDIRQLRAFSAGGTVSLDRHWLLRVAAADERREGSYHSQSVNLGIGYRFAGE